MPGFRFARSKQTSWKAALCPPIQHTHIERISVPKGWLAWS
jgi:hypothetical protein